MSTGIRQKRLADALEVALACAIQSHVARSEDEARQGQGREDAEYAEEDSRRGEGVAAKSAPGPCYPTARHNGRRHRGNGHQREDGIEHNGHT